MGKVVEAQAPIRARAARGRIRRHGCRERSTTHATCKRMERAVECNGIASDCERKREREVIVEGKGGDGEAKCGRECKQSRLISLSV